MKEGGEKAGDKHAWRAKLMAAWRGVWLAA